ncbi:hypothetical protein DM01DRAFT_1233733 [Hesseltinella vesiculosa]|uniref:Nucleoporin Nup133/Nup155-like C-terminal domain-containing protein n=1 Tax=Hesseltinella vesiculosa TaxID=101127 RepID=A0A1X2GLH9_9FUNG|nr:hypothetical protein DM01DRAFT_1233733 [Hesseltinella vesiculosa]
MARTYFHKLGTYIADLEGLQQLLQNHTSFSFNEPIYNDTQQLLSKSIEVLVFLSYLFEHKIYKDTYLSEPGRDICFSELFTEKGGEFLVVLLKEAIVISTASDSINEYLVTEDVCQLCPTLFDGKCSLRVLTGSEYLERAKRAAEQSIPESSVMVQLQHSLEKYKDAASQLSYEERDSICAKYLQMEFYNGVVQLTLCCASSSPLIQASGADMLFSPIVSMLQQASLLSKENLISALGVILEQDNKLIHKTVYTWLLNNEEMDTLLDKFASSKTVQISLPPFLQHENDFELAITLDWLSKFYERINNIDLATHWLLVLASDTDGISLIKRTAFLEKALQLLQDFNGNGSKAQTVANLIRAAKIQQQIIKFAPGQVKLGDKLFSINALFNIAFESGCWAEAICLFNMKFSSCGYSEIDYRLLRNLWTRFFNEFSSVEGLQAPLLSLGQTVNGSVAFPSNFVMRLLEEFCILHGAKSIVVTDLMANIGLPLEIIEDGKAVIKKIKK